ncbi:hypothetical protein [Erwinia mallotivora]|uniref:hypothetical protein n=1 Tax=Erwinia mallotivora TaxID=69222 RepID=UPI0021BF6F9C|nr:hypothetical protein [Erwinia mallotivora]
MKKNLAGIIEPGILPVCNALNSFEGITTLYSCEGHTWYSFRPYVSFRADEYLARMISAAVGHDMGLMYNWWVTGNFNESGEWMYCLEPNDIRIRRSLRFGIFPVWSRKVMDRELQNIAENIMTLLSITTL